MGGEDGVEWSSLWEIIGNCMCISTLRSLVGIFLNTMITHGDIQADIIDNH